MEEISIEYITKKGTVLDFVLNGITDGIYIVDPNNRIIFWNKGAEILTGYSEQEVLGYKCSDDVLNHIDENGIPICKNGCPLVTAIFTGEPTKLKVYPLHKSGKRFPVMAHVSPIKDKYGKVIAAIEVFRDISKEEDLRILQDKFNNLIRKFVSTATIERVMSQVLTGRESKSRRREMTILYLDMIQFTGLTERLIPEQIESMLNDVFGICELITKEHYGDIDKFMGDAVMAVFVDPNDAVKAAEKILSSISHYNESRELQNLEAVNIRIAINTGTVIQAEVGASGRKDMTVLGDVVNTTAKIEKMAEPNSIVITEATLSRLKSSSSFMFDRRILIKGKKEPVNIYYLNHKEQKEKKNLVE